MPSLDDLRATHQQLGSAAAHFFDYVRANPDWAEGLAERASEMPEWARFKFILSPWPLFAEGAKLEEVRRAPLEVIRLVKSVPERIFDNDPGRMASFYGLANPLLMRIFLEPPTGIAGWMCRADFIDGPAGFKCLELNMKANIGGWHLRSWKEICCGAPVLAGFMEAEGIEPRFEDPPREMIRHVVRDTLAQDLGREGELNIAFVVPPDLRQEWRPTEHLNALLADALREMAPGLGGRLLFCSYPDSLVQRQRLLYHGDTRIHAVIEHISEVTPRDVYRCFKTGRVTLYNGPLSNALSDKRNLALLSQHEDSDRFDAHERQVIRDHIPWSREVVEGPTTFHGEKVDLVPFLRAHREELVLKLGLGTQGTYVRVGWRRTQEEWEEAVTTAVNDGTWMVQELVESHSYLYDTGGKGQQAHDLIWGIFGFGPNYGGTLLRMLPKNEGDGVINSSRGAPMGYLLEVGGS